LINSGDLTVNAEVTHMGRRLRIASAKVLNSEGKLMAMATSSALVVPGGIRALMQGWIPDEVVQA
jgi:acyl-coenzyme A thioesterase PaaI-like protein